MKQNVYFVSGIDTDAGKSYATGYLAREWNKNGKRTDSVPSLKSLSKQETLVTPRILICIVVSWESPLQKKTKKD